jgi:hypothetical protein
MANAKNGTQGLFSPNERLLMEALKCLQRASSISDPAEKTKLLEEAHRLQSKAELGILEDLRRSTLAAQSTTTPG